MFGIESWYFSRGSVLQALGLVLLHAALLVLLAAAAGAGVVGAHLFGGGAHRGGLYLALTGGGGAGLLGHLLPADFLLYPLHFFLQFPGRQKPAALAADDDLSHLSGNGFQ